MKVKYIVIKVTVKKSDVDHLYDLLDKSGLFYELDSYKEFEFEEAEQKR